MENVNKKFPKMVLYLFLFICGCAAIGYGINLIVTATEENSTQFIGIACTAVGLVVGIASVVKAVKRQNQ